MISDPGRPSELAKHVLRLCLPKGFRADALLGDLHEEYLQKEAEDGRLAASFWYWRTSLGLGGRFLLERATHDRRHRGMSPFDHDPSLLSRVSPNRGSPLDSFLSDLRHAVRGLCSRPLHTAVAVLTLAVGLGAVTAIFGVVNGVLLLPLPYPGPDALFFLEERNAQDPSLSPSFPNFLDWRERNGSFQEMAAFGDVKMTLTEQGDPAQLEGWVASASLFPLLGAEAALGRTFLEEEDRLGANLAVLLSHDLWKERFEGDPEVLGRSITLSGTPWTVVGVMGPDFSFPPPSARFAFSGSDFWVPIGPVSGHWSQHRDLHPGITVLGRLKEEMTADQARLDMELIAQTLENAYPDTNTGQRVSVRAVQEVTVEDVRAPIWILQAAAGFLLFIACLNVASLQLARATDRIRELAVRSSLGASQSHPMRFVMLETVFLSLVGGGLGLGLAYGAQELYGFASNTLGSRVDRMD